MLLPMRHTPLEVIFAEHRPPAAMLRSLRLLPAHARRDGRRPDFEVLRAMQLHVDEFPERLHQRKQSALLFPKLRERCPIWPRCRTGWRVATKPAGAFTPEDWAELDAAFAAQQDPLTGFESNAGYTPLLQRILMTALAPVELGPKQRFRSNPGISATVGVR